jgi:hypothetical protein
MSVDPYLRGCSYCGEDEMSCTCLGDACECCNKRAELEQSEYNGWLCETCIHHLITECDCCGQEIFRPECYIVTNIKDGHKKDWFFCGEECAVEQREYEFRKEWV